MRAWGVSVAQQRIRCSSQTDEGFCFKLNQLTSTTHWPLYQTLWWDHWFHTETGGLWDYCIKLVNVQWNFPWFSEKYLLCICHLFFTCNYDVFLFAAHGGSRWQYHFHLWLLHSCICAATSCMPTVAPQRISIFLCMTSWLPGFSITLKPTKVSTRWRRVIFWAENSCGGTAGIPLIVVGGKEEEKILNFWGGTRLHLVSYFLPPQC